jgi:hypothetical protein
LDLVFNSLRGIRVRPRNESSFTLVAWVATELLRWEKRKSVVVVAVLYDAPLAEDFTLCGFVLPEPYELDGENSSPFIGVFTRTLNRFRDRVSASSPKMAALDRVLAVGVEGLEFCM